MRIRIDRIKNIDDGTIGELKIFGGNKDVVFKCFTLEPAGDDEVRSGLDKRIPEGDYNMEWYNSPRFKRALPRLYNKEVSKDRCILIHNGNYPDDTEGCILLGMDMGKYGVFNSIKAMERFTLITRDKKIDKVVISNKGLQ